VGRHSACAAHDHHTQTHAHTHLDCAPPRGAAHAGRPTRLRRSSHGSQNCAPPRGAARAPKIRLDSGKSRRFWPFAPRPGTHSAKMMRVRAFPGRGRAPGAAHALHWPRALRTGQELAPTSKSTAQETRLSGRAGVGRAAARLPGPRGVPRAPGAASNPRRRPAPRRAAPRRSPVSAVASASTTGAFDARCQSARAASRRRRDGRRAPSLGLHLRSERGSATERDLAMRVLLEPDLGFLLV
jgi:hypothetical protein